MLHPEALTAASMRDALDRLLERPPPRPSGPEYGGSERAAEILTELAGEPAPRISVPLEPMAVPRLAEART